MSFTPSGYVAESYDEIIADINAIYVSVFGATVNLNPASPNGQAINKFANMAIQNQNFMLLLTNAIYNPDIASSVWLDALCAPLGIKRLASSQSYVNCLCLGSAGTVIPAGTQISSTNGDIFTNLAGGTIDQTGQTTIIFTAVQTGPIAVLANTLTNIVNSIYGWDSVNNPSNGTIGGSTESDNELRATRSSLLNFYGSASLGAIYSAVINVDGVTDVYPAENDTGAPIVIDGVTLIANSIYVAAIGGVDIDIATAIATKKVPGIPQNGNTPVQIINKWGGTNTVTFQRPTPVPLQVNVSIVNSSTYPPDFVTQIQNSIVNNFNGTDLLIPALAVKIAQVINCSRFYPSLIAVGAWNVSSPLTIQLATGGTPKESIQLPANQIGTLTQSNVKVTLV